jgi:[acyl-carrier-protein] S-malonyltransferase
MSFSYIGIFPGQGSQKVGMGKDFYDAWNQAKEMFTEADDTLGFYLSKLCFEGPADELVKTEFVQPAILVVSCIAHAMLVDKLGGNILCSAAGHSLGEYSALVSAGAIKYSDAVKLVHNRGKYMQQAVPLGVGKMLAVIGMDLEPLEIALKEVQGVAEIANINAPGQIVVSGEANAIDQLKEVLKTYRTIELPVSAPFHCSLMKPAADRLSPDLDALNITKPYVPVYANVLAEGLIEPSSIKQALKDQVCGRVRWVDCMKAMLAINPDNKVVEFGAGGVLTGLLKRIDKTAQKASVGSIEELNEFIK